MKKILFVVLMLTVVSVYAQEKSSIIKDEKTGRNMFVGTGDKSVFKDTSFSAWYNAEHDVYKVDEETIKLFTPEKLNDIKITIVLGTWCKDTKREVPRFMKILEAINFDEKNLAMYFVNREKKNPHGDVEQYKAKNIPTIIVTRGGEELGRIIEEPKESLEKDFWGMIK